MKLINKKDDQIVFRAEIDESLANAIRRYLNQIPILAIDEIDISKNDSPLYDETVAHRLGLIPLKIDKIADLKKDAKLKLNVNKEGMVYSGELKGNINSVYDKIPITTLKKGQELELVATARSGTGTEHSKFSPGLMFYRNIFNVDIGKDCPADVIGVCPKEILKKANGKIIASDPELCDMCEVCMEKCEKLGKKECIEITPTKELAITLESFGQLDVRDIFKKAVDVLKKDLNEVAKKANK